MPLDSSDIQIIATIVSQMIHEKQERVAEHGVAVGSSWSAVDNAGAQIDAGTIQSTSGKTAAILGDDGDTGLAKPRLNVATMMVGDQYGPIGNERVVIIPTETAEIALFIHGPDDSPGAPAGERWICHRNPTTGKVDSYIKLTNDGSTPGDGKGGLKLGFAEFATIDTSGGHSITLDDVAKKITITSAGGLTIILDDNTGTIQHAGSGNTSGDAIVRQSDLAAHIADVKSYINSHTHTGVQTGGGTSATVASPYNPAAATGSAKTFTA